ncbi:MAG: sulfatase-like hydrolase/transferase [Puniceicoccaceae bacterium]
MKITITAFILFVLTQWIFAASEKKPNIIVIFADDISAREFPAYGGTEWSAPKSHFNKENSNPAYRARTPVLDAIAREGAVIRTAWANAVCSPSRATLMTGRYGHLHKWWQNNDLGKYINEKGKLEVWPLYKSSPLMIGHIAKLGGYATFWAGKTQMKNSRLSEFGFDAVMTTPGNDLGLGAGNPNTDFKLIRKPGLPKDEYFSDDTGLSINSVWPEQSFFWQPSVGTWNWPIGSAESKWWPVTRRDRKKFGINTYGPDLEMEFIFAFMEHARDEGKPFFIYHTPHLGHAARNWLAQDPASLWYPGTPKIEWDGNEYSRTESLITGDEGDYDTHDTVTGPGIHHHINYLDYQVWQYMQKLDELGIRENTIFIFTADNGTLGYGKMQKGRQRGPRVPFYIYVPGMIKHGMQDILVDVADILPTIADAAGVDLPDDYEINGKSLIPYLTANQTTHRDWIYSFLFERQMIRGHHVLRDLNGDWWDVSNEPADLDSYPKITDWESLPDAHIKERELLEKILPRFDKHATGHGAPGTVY